MIWEQEENYSPDFEGSNWSEDDWERFFQEQERRAEQYQKKFIEAYNKYEEQYSSDEELSKKIQSDLNTDSPEIHSHWLEDAQEMENELNTLEPWEEEELEQELSLEEITLETLPVYQYAFGFSLSSARFLKTLYEKGLDTPELHQFHLHCYQIAAHIVGGHALGFEKDGLTGNIAKLKRSLKSANYCLEALYAVKRKQLTDDNSVESLIQDNIQVRDSLIHYIEELRHQVWW